MTELYALTPLRPYAFTPLKMKLLNTIVFSLLVLCPASPTLLKSELPTSEQKNTVPVIYSSVDGGRSWMPFDNGIPHDATVSSFHIQDDLILAATDFNGIYSIRAGEMQWKRIDAGLSENIDINVISVIENTLIIGTHRHGILISKNNGKNWTNPAKQISGTSVRSLHAKGRILFAGTDNGIYRSMDNGNTWEHIWKGVQVNGFTEMNNMLFAAVMNGAIKSGNDGMNWEYVYKPNALHDISNDGENIYAMTLGAGLKKSGNQGITWESANNGLGTFNLYTFEIKKFQNKLFAAQWYGIYSSEDRGRNWKLIRNGLPDSTAFTTLETTKNGLIAGIGLRKKA